MNLEPENEIEHKCPIKCALRMAQALDFFVHTDSVMIPEQKSKIRMIAYQEVLWILEGLLNDNTQGLTEATEILQKVLKQGQAKMPYKQV